MGLGDGLNLGVSDAIQAIQSAAGIISNANSKATLPGLPWQGEGGSTINSAFFHSIQINPQVWDQLLPYRLLVIDTTNNKIVAGDSGNTALPQITLTPGTGTALVNFIPSGSTAWVFQLPISPQQLTIQDQYAIQTTATLRGVMEEHSGVRFKMISAQGTLGVWPQRSSLTKPPGTPGILQSVFGGTINAIGNVVSSVSSVINIATGNNPSNKPTSLRPETSQFGYAGTGYYQALQLQQFLEQYAEAKKDPKKASWRLVFDIPKQNQSFVVTPVVYSWQQNANKPMEFLFNFQLKAWRRIDLSQTQVSAPANNQPLSPGILQRILGTLAAARQTMGSILNLLGAVRSDVEAPLDILRQTVLFVKDLAGVAVTAVDLPNQVIQAYQSQISTSLNTLSTTIQSTVTDAPTLKALATVIAATAAVEGLSQAAVAGGQLGTVAATNYTLSAANAIFATPAMYYTLLDQVPVSSLSLTAAQQNQVNEIINTASQLTVATLKQYRANILQLALQLSNNFGSGSAYYNALFNQTPLMPVNQPITLDQYEILDTLYEALASYDILTATTQVDDLNIQNAIDYVAGLASTNGIEFTINGETSGKILVPVPYGLTIEGISARYLGDPQRWIEITTLNDLREPYIDENGFQLPLLSNGVGRQVVVASDQYLYLGQVVFLNSLTQPISARTVTGLKQLSPTSVLVTFDGLANLNTFLLADRAYIQCYLPGTVNSQQKIFVPTDLPVPPESSIIPPPGTTTDPLTGLSKVDWLLQSNGDLAINNYGDFRYSYGITEIMQALQVMFGTQAGKDLLNPNFGLNIKPGTINADLQLQDLYNSINQMIAQDPRFSGISNLNIMLNGPTLGINLGVTIPGQTGVFPVSFALQNN
jgi:hypothetical protein